MYVTVVQECLSLIVCLIIKIMYQFINIFLLIRSFIFIELSDKKIEYKNILALFEKSKGCQNKMAFNICQ